MQNVFVLYHIQRTQYQTDRPTRRGHLLKEDRRCLYTGSFHKSVSVHRRHLCVNVAVRCLKQLKTPSLMSFWHIFRAVSAHLPVEDHLHNDFTFLFGSSLFNALLFLSAACGLLASFHILPNGHEY